jgi:hypothetical protein
MPAYAAPHDALADGTYPGIQQSTTAATVSDTLTICEIATDVDAVPNSPCFFGVIDTTGPAAAIVSSDLNGEIHHIGVATGVGGDVSLTLVNDGSAEIGAIAVATSGTPAAFAQIGTAIEQRGSAPDDVTLMVDNNDMLLIDAIAVASGANATANASIANGIMQTVLAGGDASIGLVNDGTISFVASGSANGTGNVNAGSFSAIQAHNLIVQDAVAIDNAAVNLTNNGSIAIAVHAGADGDVSVDANAFISNAVQQTGDGGADSNGTATLANNGSLTIDVSATGSATSGTILDVSARGNDLIGQFAEAFGSAGTTSVAASAVISNSASGVIAATFLADANGTGAVPANATAAVSSFINQRANAFGDAAANVSLDNQGSITLSVTADAAGLPGGPTATPVFGLANATAVINGAITQVANADSGNASVSLTNGGSIDVGALALAAATGGSANANATINNAIFQSATATSGDSFATLTNGGTIAIHATASATGDVAAVANITGGIRQVAHAGTTEGAALTLAFVTSTLNDAFVSMTNSGSITIADNAVVNNTGTGLATATAQVTSAIAQTATATGNAGAFLGNSGSIAISAAATANAATGTAVVGGSALANATVDFAIQQNVSGGGTASALFSNSGTVSVAASANAFGEAISVANANVNNGLYQIVSAGSTGLATFNNGGSITLSAIAAATGGLADANAFAEYIMEQDVGAFTSAAAVISNSGTMALTASAAAVGTKSAYATATANEALVQEVGAFGTASASILNSGSLAINAIADASASGYANASAHVDQAIVQNVGAFSSAAALLSNSGTVTIAADAHATAGSTASAAATVGTLTGSAPAAINQLAGAFGNASVALANSGSILIDAHASAGASSAANATANAFGLYQSAGAGSIASASVANSGTMTVAASATASAGSTAIAAANVLGGSQTVSAGGSALALVDNSGSLVVSGIAVAAASSFASASANALGFVQNANGGTAQFTNGGTFSVVASASASGFTGIAGAHAIGLKQAGDETTIFSNDGSFSVSATALATAFSGAASATALGYGVSGVAVTLDVTNDGDFTVAANATAPSTAFAHAVGMSFAAAGTTLQAALIDGTLVNSGNINVQAAASGTFFSSAATATATGILMTSGINTATVTNTGSIAVDAITNGGPATARGIVAAGNGTGVAPGLTDVLTINNSGDLIVRQSTNGGGSWARGMAIDVALAPNNTVINLLGGGDIYGNIDVQAGDVINVDNGETSFDGIINPECMPPVFDGAASSCGQGTLNITSDGILFLRVRRNDAAFASMYDGPSYVFVDTFNMVPGATLTFELPTSTTGGTQPIGSYPQVFADVANLDGNLRLRPDTATGLFADNYFFNNVIDANVRNGTFDTCGLDGTFADSAFLTLTCIYDTANNVDLGLARTPFDEIPGLGINETAVAGGLECIFDPDLTGSLGAVLADLFTFNAAQAAMALNQLAGGGYASYLSSFSSLGVRYNDVLAHATDCEVPALAGSVLECRTAPTHMWVQVDFQNRKTDGDREVGGYEADRWTGLVGFDMSVGNTAIVGASIGKVTNHLDFKQYNALYKADGYQLGAYAVFDPGTFYVKALGTYNWYDGDSVRHINFVPLSGTVKGQLTADPDVKMWTLGLHGGFRVGMGPSSVLTPYLNLDYTHTKMDGFAEVGMGDVGLTTFDAKENRTTLTGGVKWAGDIGGVVPEVDLGYRYQFGDKRSNFRAMFLNDEDCAFDIVSEAEKRGAFLAGLSIGGKAGPVDVRVGYQGLFSGQATSHAGNFRLILPLGGTEAPPPPEPVYVAPPPPPAPEPVVEPAPPPPPPPPPPPAPSGERG